jgi:hexosaminidase
MLFKITKIVKIFILILFLGLSFLKVKAQQSVSIVPYPTEVKADEGFMHLKQRFHIGYSDKILAPVAQLLVKDIYTLYQLSATVKNEKANIFLHLDYSLGDEENTIQINDTGIIISGGSYNAVCMGVTSILQLAKSEGDQLRFPRCTIRDKPASEYRGVMLDVARQWHNIETVKQVVELCRWYKIKYLQLHLSDDQSFTFPSLTYPKLATKGRHYTLKELKELVEFAKVRGVVIIPEFDVPGHTTAIRQSMPELFGRTDLGVINMANEKVFQVLETVMKEMMDVFYTSPYFHIGGDETWLGEFQKEKETKEFIEAKGLDNVEDVYLNFMVRINDIVKKRHKKTLVWESFPSTGSIKVKIPKDITVFAWETAYQRPDSLLKNGYKIINASWKPAYVTPGFHWTPEYIYHWNIHRWENHWNGAPSYNPIQLDKSAPILGGQMCSWEMSEEEEIPNLHQRVPAISEVLWNGDKRRVFSDYRERYLVTDYKFNQLIFPVGIFREGFTEPDNERNYNAENEFSDIAILKFSSVLPHTKITYTTDGTVPTIHSPKLPTSLTIKKDFEAKLSVFDKQSNRIGYRIIKYSLNAIVPKITGNTLALKDTNFKKSQIKFIGQVILTLHNLKKESVIRYTIDGTIPSLSSPLYSGPVQINHSQIIKAVCFFKGDPFGKMFQSEFIKEDFEKNITTGKRIFAIPAKDSGININKAVDGFVDRDNYWDSENKPASIIVDLNEVAPISKLVLFTYWGDERFYKYTVEVSTNGEEWKQVIDRSENTERSTKGGYSDRFLSHPARFIKINMLDNSANNSMHIVEIRAY